MNCAEGRWLAAPFFHLYSPLLLVLCGEKALLVCLFFYSVDIPAGGNPEFLIKCRALHIRADILDGSQLQSLQCSRRENPRQPQRPEQKREMTYAADLEMCVTSSILSLTASLCFKCMSRPCTQRSDPAKEFLPASLRDGLCGANLICGPAQTMWGFEQICCAPELGDEEEQHGGEWGLCEPLKIRRALAGCHKTQRPCRQNRMVNHYISAPNTQEGQKRLQRASLHHRYHW